MSHASAAENYITVVQAIENNTGTATVKGYIVAHTLAKNSYDFEAPFGNDYNLAIADSPTETDPAKILPVQLPSGFRAEFGLATNPSNIGKAVLISGALEAYFTVPGLKSPTEISFSDDSGGPVDPPQQPKAIDLTIMHVNDTHANVEKYPRLTTAVKQVRSEKPNALLVDAGDVFSGTLYFNQYLGKADLWFMNKLGYDAMTFGNHEFDRDAGTLASFIGEMTFPMVSANVNVSKNSVLGPLFKDDISTAPKGGNIYPAIVKTIDGEKVGIFGLTTEDTTYLANPAKDIVFENAVEEAKSIVAALQAQGINKIVALSHLGYGPDQDLAKAVDGIDVIVGGHTHTKLDKPVVIEKAEPTVIVQANEYLKYLGVLNVSFDENGVVSAEDGTLLDTTTFAEDAEALAKINELKAPLEELKKQIVGSTNVVLDGERSNVRYKETNLGNLITDAMVDRANQMVPDTFIGMQNGGGIRASIQQGDVTLGDIYTVMPFANLLVTLDLTGEEIWQALEHSVSKVDSGAGQFMQVSGIQFKYDPAKPAFDRVWDVKVKTANGFESIDLTKTYSVATNAFVADGGDGYTVFKKAKDEGRIHELLIVDYEILVDYFTKNSPVAPTVEGRILAETEPVQQTGWVQEEGAWYYYDENGVKQTGWIELKGKTYYLDSETGEMKTFWLELDGQQYYLGSDGVRVTGLASVQGKGYYFGETGVMQTGWLELAGKKYYFGTNGVMRVGKCTIEGKDYYFNTNGVMQTGLIKIDGKTYYFGYDGVMWTGWYFGEPWRFFGEDGAMVTGWLEFNGETHYFKEDGSAVKGWYQIDGKLYYFSEYGIMAKGLYDVNGQIHYFGDNGIHQTGWVEINGHQYYLDEATGEFKAGWFLYDNNWFYQNSKGLLTNWAKVNGKWYYFDATGVMRTGWIKEQGKWYLLGVSGTMVTGWAIINGEWYYMNTHGVMQTGWVYTGGKWYYLYASGKMASNTTIQGFKIGGTGAWIR